MVLFLLVAWARAVWRRDRWYLENSSKMSRKVGTFASVVIHLAFRQATAQDEQLNSDDL